MKARTGRCQCGEIRYESVGEPLALYICHCRECQKQSASAFGISFLENIYILPDNMVNAMHEQSHHHNAGEYDV